ncbi:MAG: hypothetical protein ACTSWQ_00225 [Candidatus Thorarchaeota archaeon]
MVAKKMRDRNLTMDAKKKLIRPLKDDRVKERDQRRPKKYNVGRLTNLTYGAWFIEAFMINEDQPQKDKWNDATIANMAAKEFPEKTKAHRERQVRDKKPTATDAIGDVARYRAHYHRQTINNLQKKPKRLSCRYDNHGNPIDQHKRHLTFKEFKRRCKLHRINDSRLKNPPVNFFYEE